MNKDNVAKWADDHIVVLGRGKAASEATKAALVAKLERDEAEETSPAILIGDDAAAAYFKQLERDEAAAKAQA
jgi:hypothetical protein